MISGKGVSIFQFSEEGESFLILHFYNEEKSWVWNQLLLVIFVRKNPEQKNEEMIIIERQQQLLHYLHYLFQWQHSPSTEMHH